MKSLLFILVSIVSLTGANTGNEQFQPSVPSYPQKPSLGNIVDSGVLESGEGDPSESSIAPQFAQDGVVSVPEVHAGVTAEVEVVNPRKGLQIGGDVVERSVAAVVMLGIVTLVVRQFGQKGIIGFILLCQSVMYNESCHLLESSNGNIVPLNISPVVPIKLQQVWWFLTAQAASSFRYLNLFYNDHVCKLLSFGMAATSLIVGVLTMAQQGSDDSTFRSYMANVASSHFALLFLVAQSAAWILTLQEFGTSWFLLPALLVIVNDTMAYVFGRLLGKHKLIPSLSP